MELNINVENKDLEYSLGSVKGQGLDALIKSLGEYKFDKLSLSGESKSYTFLRQVALLVNILVKINKCSLELSSNSFSREGDLIFPIYK